MEIKEEPIVLDKVKEVLTHQNKYSREDFIYLSEKLAVALENSLKAIANLKEDVEILEEDIEILHSSRIRTNEECSEVKITK